jgi:hypothetical protein
MKLLFTARHNDLTDHDLSSQFPLNKNQVIEDEEND